MVHLKIDQNQVTVYDNDIVIGVIELYRNSFHMQNQYLKMEHIIFDPKISSEIFRKLFDIIRKPLQIMTDSENLPLIEFITAGGFVCKRKCYAVEATLEDYIGKIRKADILQTQRGEAKYGLCCRLLYDRYAEAHSAINPLTADYATFASDLPDFVFYQEVEGDFVSCFAFVEENEIAYVFDRNESNIFSFAEALITRLFAKYQTICFEADDCDQTAMQWKNLFMGQSESSFDTYIYDYKPVF